MPMIFIDRKSCDSVRKLIWQILKKYKGIIYGLYSVCETRRQGISYIFPRVYSNC